MAKSKHIPFIFTNEAKEGKHIVTLSGNIRKRYWSDDEAIDAKLVRTNLENVTDDIVIKLNSPGGDVFQGIEIYNFLKDHPSKVTVEVTGEAASAATFILAGANKVIMNTGTTMMIHEASTWTYGNKADIQKTLGALETIDQSLIDIYVEQTGQTAEQITDWMAKEKWFTADEAVEYGFADEVKKIVTTESVSMDDISAMIDAKFAAMAKAIPQTQPKNKSLLGKLRKEVI